MNLFTRNPITVLTDFWSYWAKSDGTEGRISFANLLLLLPGSTLTKKAAPYVPVGTTETIDLSLGNLQTLDLGSASGNVTLTFDNPTDPEIYILKIIQGATPRTLVFPGNVLWEGGEVLIPSTSEDDEDVISMFYDGTNYYATYILNYS